VRHLNATVKIYGIPVKPEDLVKPEPDSAGSLGASLVLIAVLGFCRLFV
jgi:hypothetical protein